MLHNEQFVKDVNGVWHKMDNILRIYVTKDRRSSPPNGFMISCWIKSNNEGSYYEGEIAWYQSKEEADVVLSKFMASFPTYKEISA